MKTAMGGPAPDPQDRGFLESHVCAKGAQTWGTRQVLRFAQNDKLKKHPGGAQV